MACFLGIDIGARTSKGVIIEDDKVKAYHSLLSGINYREAAQRLRDELLAKTGLLLGDIAYTIATGVGAQNVSFSQQKVDDLRCCARGVNYFFPEAKMVIDVGGTSSRVTQIDKMGRVINFIVSEKCAAGSGYFLETIANVLRIKLEDIGPLSLTSQNPVTFTTGCAVFGESEAVSRVSEGFSKEDILAGVHRALASKISTLVARVGLEEPCVISGGGGLDIGLIRSIEEELGIQLLVPPEPQFITALGAAVLAKKTWENHRSKPIFQ
jgi:predicted CoA-substrate-specific enzyme activase